MLAPESTGYSPLPFSPSARHPSIVTVIRIPSSVPYDSNIFLVTGVHPMLVDAGTGEDSSAVISRIRSFGIVPETVVATHCHYDHVGGLRDIVDAFGCRALAGRVDARFIRSPDPVFNVSRMFGGSVRPVDVGDLSEGSIVSTGEHSFRVIETPGHTAGSICLYEDSTGILFSGDTLFASGFGRTDLPGGSPDAMRRSLGVLSNIDISGLFPGHGNVIEDYRREYLVQVLCMAGV